jgi:hypothetical protein
MGHPRINLVVLALLLMMILPSEMDCGVGGMKVEEDAMG